MHIYKYIVCIFYILWMCFSVNAQQWNITTDQRVYDSIYFSAHDQLINFKTPLNKKSSNYTFFPLIWNEPIIESSINPFKKNKSKNMPIDIASKEFLNWDITFNKEITIIENLCLYLNLYCEGVDTLLILAKSTTNNHYVYKHPISMDYYQVPGEINFDNFRSVKDRNKRLDLNDKIDKLTFICRETTVNKKKSKCIIGDLKIYSLSTKRVPAQGLFFYELSKNILNYPNTDISPNIFYHYNILQAPVFNNEYSSDCFFEVDSTENQEKCTLQLLYYIIGKYPYFSERGKDKGVFLDSVNSIINSLKPFSTKIAEVDSCIGSINDPHFYIQKSKNNVVHNLKFPVIITQFLDGFYITAVDKTTDVKVGTKIVKINGVTVQLFCDSLNLDSGNLQQGLNSLKDSSITLESDQNELIILNKKEKVTYPDNYHKPNMLFRIIDDQYVYFSMNRWGLGGYLYFTNCLRNHDLKKIKSFIFDLRNNGGGEELEVIRFMSLFVDKPCVYNNESFVFKDKLIRENIIIAPDRNIQLRDKKIAILINKNTACASEIFIANMKKYAPTSYVVGQENTAGAYAAVSRFHLPCGIEIMANVLTKKEWPEYQIENVGIKPDIYVYTYETNDLYPFNDKILEQAIKCIK